MGEDVGDELADVVVDDASLLDGRDDRREVVIGEHHRRRFTRYVGARSAHRDADVCPPQGGRIVDAVAGHRDGVALGAQRIDHEQFRLGVRARDDQLVCLVEDPVKLGLWKRVDLGAGHHGRFAADDARLTGDRLRRETVVAGDHDDPDAGGAAARDGIGHLGAQRILERRHPEERQV